MKVPEPILRKLYSKHIKLSYCAAFVGWYIGMKVCDVIFYDAKKY
jgi:hypothetical protein